MITKYKDSVRLAYQKLYEDIDKASNGEIQIDNLESFFGYIQEIGELDKKFLRLPLDEPLFEIDANSRKITIPSDFAANGLSVQGDHLAETVFFSIDRYFDYMDLNNCNIRINWKIGDVSGQSVNFSKSVDAEPGKIIFGWPVAKDLTGKSGTLSFAVEFYIERDNVISYSLNTLISTINIKEGLVLINPTVINVNDDILNMLQNSSFGEGEAEVPDLAWLTNGLVTNPDSTVALEFINLAGNAIDNGDSQTLSSVPVKLYARAQAGAADIKYSAPIRKDNPVDVVDEYVLVSKKDENDKRIPLDPTGTYYIKEGSAYNIASSEDVRTWNDLEIAIPNKSELYARYSTIEVNGVGEYYIQAQGIIFDKDNKKIGQGVLKPTPAVICPEPDAPAEITITSNNSNLEDEGYDIDLSMAGSVAFLTGDAVTLTATASGYDNRDAYEAPAVGVEPKALVQYAWYKDGNETPVNTSKWIRSNKNNSFSVSEEGKYVVGVKTFLNGKTTLDETKSKEYIVSPLASKIEENSIILGLNKQGGQYWINLSESVNGTLDKNTQKSFDVKYVLIPTNEKTYSDEVTCTLYQLPDAESDDTNPIFVCELESSDVEGGKHTTITSSMVGNQEGNYFIRVTNKYNGSAYSLNSDAFYINIK